MNDNEELELRDKITSYMKKYGYKCVGSSYSNEIYFENKNGLLCKVEQGQNEKETTCEFISRDYKTGLSVIQELKGSIFAEDKFTAAENHITASLQLIDNLL